MNCIKKLHRRIAVICMITCAVYAQAATTFEKPDFAYPRDVIRDADAALRAAVKSGDSQTQLLALMQKTIAAQSIDEDSLKTSINRVLEYGAKQPTTTAKAFFNIYAAELYQQFYNDNRWTIRRRQLPEGTRPTDIAEWDEKAFKTVVDSLATSAWELSDDTPLTEWAKVLDYNRLTLVYYPTVSDFVAAKILSGVTGSEALTTRVRDQIIDKHGEGSAAWMFWKAEAVKRQPVGATNALLALWDKYSDSPNSEVIVYEILDNSVGLRTLNGDRQYLTTLETFAEKTRGTWVEAYVTNAIGEFMQPYISLSFVGPGIVGKDLVGKYCARNLKTAKIRFFRDRNGAKRNGKADYTVLLDINADDPTVKKTDSLTVRLPRGDFYYDVVLDGKRRSSDIGYVRVIEYIPIVSDNVTNRYITMIEAGSGEPVPGLEIFVDDGYKKSAKKLVGKTDKNGTVRISDRLGGTIYYRVDKQFVNTSRRIYVVTGDEDDVRPLTTTVSTDLSAYRPGQQVRWTSVTADTAGVAAGVKLFVELSSPDKTLTRDTVVTDEYGRASGAFVIPEDTRMGNHLIEVTNRYSDASVTFTVGEFSMPQARIDSITATPMPKENAVRVTAKASTYAGLPVADATAVVSLTRKDDKVLRDTVTTDRQGHFEIRLDSILSADTDGDAEPLNIYARYSNSYQRTLYGEISLTTPAGVTVSQEYSFDALYPNSLSVDLSQDVDRGNNYDLRQPIRVKTTLTAPDRSAIEHVKLNWRLTASNDSVIRRGEMPVGEAVIDLADIAIGTYTLTVCPSDSLAAESNDILVLYDTKTAKLPSEDVIWSPDYSREISDGIVTLGVAEDDTYVMFVSDACATPVIKCYKAGWHSVNIYEIVGDKAGKTIVAAVRQGRNSMIRFNVAKRETPDINIITETFRDRINAGSTEQWRIRTVDANGQGISAALALNMYDTRILTFKPMNRLYPSLAYRFGRTANIDLYNNRGYGLTEYINFEDKDVIALYAPQWLYTQSLYNYAIRKGRRLYASASMSKMESNDVLDEVVIEANNAEAPMLDEMVVVAYGIDHTDAGAEASLEQVVYHKDDTYCALWMPTMVTDEQGYADISFDVPSTPTTWKFTATAWTKNLYKAYLEKTVTSVKPVMVKAVVPQFLRRGDYAEILSTITNNSNEAGTITALTEVYDLRTDSVLASRKTTIDLAAGESKIVPMEVTRILTTIDADSIGFRVKAASSLAGDGEQYAIPLLASSARVTDSRNFYIGAKDGQLTLSLPAIKGENAERRLHFTANPMWTVIDALPTVTAMPSSTSTSAVNAYFGAVILLNLVEQHPELDISADVKNTQQVRSASVRILRNLQRRDGGWAWGSWCSESSLWSTEVVLDRLATLRLAGYDTSDLDDVIKDALAYVDSRVKAPDMTYAIFRSAWTTPRPSLNGQSVIDRTVQYVLKNWKKYDVHNKAIAALVLQYNRNHAMARTVMTSIDQYGTHRPGKGMEFRNVRSLLTYGNLLEAYAAVTGQSAQTDAVREYLIVRRQGTDWGSGNITSYVVDAFVNSGTSWVSAPVTPYVTFNGAEIAIDRLDSRKGIVDAPVADITAGDIVIDKRSDVPAYGAVADTYTAEAGDIKAFSDGEVSVTKQLTVTAPDGKTYRIDDKSNIPVGSTVTVRLTVKADRPYSYITIADERPAGLIPQEQVSQYVWSAGLGAYRESRADRTNFYIDYMPKGVYVFEYKLNATVAGTYTSGVATIVCDQAPDLTAHSAGTRLTVSK